MQQNDTPEVLDWHRGPHHILSSRQTFLLSILFAITFTACWMGAEAPQSVAYYSTVLGCTLLALVVFDIRHGRLPNYLTLPLIPAGLTVAFILNESGFSDHVIGSLIAWLLFAALRTSYQWLRGVDGLGQGDIKLVAAIGAWLGWQGLPTVVLEASLLGLLWVAFLTITRRPVGVTERLPFGPFLSLACWITWLYGPLATQ